MAGTDLAVKAFDYGDLDGSAADRIREAAQRIRHNTSAAAILAGRDLLEVKNLPGHGRFLAWLESEFSWTERHAQRLMQAAQWADGKDELVSLLRPTALYMLSAPETPPEVVEAVEAKVRAGEAVSPRAIQKMMNVARGSRLEPNARAEPPKSTEPAPADPKVDAAAGQAAFLVYEGMRRGIPVLLRLLKVGGDEGSAFYRNLAALAEPRQKAAE